MRRRDMVPILMSSLLLAAICMLAFLRHEGGIGAWAGYPVDPDILFSALYVVWILVEFPIANKDVNTEGKKTSDSGTCLAYASAQGCTLLTALWFPSLWAGPGAVHVVGFVLFLCGVLYRLWAVRTLGQFYSHRVRRVERHRIVDSGPYRFTRHPAYAGMIAAHVGVMLYFFNLVTLAVLLFAFIPSIVQRIRVEEKMLFEIEGYSDFAGKRKRLMPAVW